MIHTITSSGLEGPPARVGRSGVQGQQSSPAPNVSEQRGSERGSILERLRDLLSDKDRGETPAAEQAESKPRSSSGGGLLARLRGQQPAPRPDTTPPTLLQQPPQTYTRTGTAHAVPDAGRGAVLNVLG